MSPQFVHRTVLALLAMLRVERSSWRRRRSRVRSCPAPQNIPAPAPAGDRCALRAADDSPGWRRADDLSAELAVPQGRSASRSPRSTTCRRVCLDRHPEHRQHSQPVDRVPPGRSGASIPARWSCWPRAGAQHAERRHRERRFRAFLLQLRRQHRHPANMPRTSPGRNSKKQQGAPRSISEHERRRRSRRR